MWFANNKRLLLFAWLATAVTSVALPPYSTIEDHQTSFSDLAKRDKLIRFNKITFISTEDPPAPSNLDPKSITHALLATIEEVWSRINSVVATYNGIRFTDRRTNYYVEIARDRSSPARMHDPQLQASIAAEAIREVIKRMIEEQRRTDAGIPCESISTIDAWIIVDDENFRWGRLTILDLGQADEVDLASTQFANHTGLAATYSSTLDSSSSRCPLPLFDSPDASLSTNNITNMASNFEGINLVAHTNINKSLDQPLIPPIALNSTTIDLTTPNSTTLNSTTLSDISDPTKLKYTTLEQGNPIPLIIYVTLYFSALQNHFWTKYAPGSLPRIKKIKNGDPFLSVVVGGYRLEVKKLASSREGYMICFRDISRAIRRSMLGEVAEKKIRVAFEVEPEAWRPPSSIAPWLEIQVRKDGGGAGGDVGDVDGVGDGGVDGDDELQGDEGDDGEQDEGSGNTGSGKNIETIA